MKIIPLSEGAFTVDGTKKFVPFDPSKDELTDRPRGSLLVEIQPFLILLQNDVLLLDTGLGFTDPDGTLQIHRLLAEHGIEPGAVTKVLMSHLHKDHSGGMMMPNKRVPAFENATYYVNRQEWDAGIDDSSSYFPDNYKYLKNLQFTEGSGEISDQIEYLLTGGHSEHHQAFKISEGDDTAFFGGDVASQSQQLKTRYKAKYDFDPERAMNLRAAWRAQGEEEGWSFLFYHDMKKPVQKY